MSNTVFVNNLTALGGSGTITIKSGTTIKGEGGSILTPGLITQVKYKQTPPYRFNYKSQDITEITGTAVDFRCYRGSSKVLVQGVISTNSPYVSSFGVLVDGAKQWDASGNNNSAGAMATQYVGNGAANTGLLWYGGTKEPYITNSRNANSSGQENMYSIHLQYIYTPGDAGIHNYSLGACCSWAGDAGYQILINDRWDIDMRGTTSICVMELSQT